MARQLFPITVIGLTFVHAAILLNASPAHAIITWGAATNSSSISDLSITGGTVLYALNGGSAAADSSGTGTGLASPFNVGGINFVQSTFTTLPTGVTFTPTGSDAGDTAQSRWVNDRYRPATSGVSMISTGNAAYDYLLKSSTDAFGTPTGIQYGALTFGGLTSGYDYQFQVWYNEPNGADDKRIMRFGDGAGNYVQLRGGDANGVTNGDNYGQFAIGTFTASGTSQTLTLDTEGKFPNVHFSAILLQSKPFSPSSTPLPSSGTSGWTIETQEQWAAAASAVSNLNVANGQVIPNAGTATFESKVQSFTQKQKFTKVTFEQDAAWKATQWRANDGSIVDPVPNGDAPVFVSPAENDYWYLNATSGGGDYNVYHSTDMKNWTNHGNVTGVDWVTSAEYKDGTFYVYYDHENDQDPHLVTFTNLASAATRTDHGRVFDAPTPGSDMAIFRNLDGTWHIIREDWAKIKASSHSWDSQVAEHTISPDGITGWNSNIQSPLFDMAGSPTGAGPTNYNHPYMGTISYIPHTLNDAWGDYEMLRIGDTYYLFADDHPNGKSIGLGYWYSNDINGPFTYGGKIIDNLHPDPTAGFAEGQFFIMTQGRDLLSSGPWADAVLAQAGVDTDGDGTADVWTDWQIVKETYGRIDGFAKVFSVDPACLDLSSLPDGFGIQFRFQTSDAAAVMESIHVESFAVPAPHALSAGLALLSILVTRRHRTAA
jgi:hypothetical protein